MTESKSSFDTSFGFESIAAFEVQSFEYTATVVELSVRVVHAHSDDVVDVAPDFWVDDDVSVHSDVRFVSGEPRVGVATCTRP